MKMSNKAKAPSSTSSPNIIECKRAREGQDEV